MSDTVQTGDELDVTDSRGTRRVRVIGNSYGRGIAVRNTTSNRLSYLRLPDSRVRLIRDRRTLPPDGPDVGADVPGGGAV